MEGQASTTRTFKTAWFTKAARKARISDAELCEAIAAVMKGQADDLGGGVFKKRLDRNRQRSIALATSGGLWVYAYLFAKKDRANIEDDELIGFRKLAKGFSALTPKQLSQLLEDREWMEICHDDQVQIQE